MTRKKLSIILAVCVMTIIVAIFAIFLRQDNSTQPAQAPKLTMIALGDSIAAGIGLPTASDISRCDRTEESYPSVLATKLNYDLVSYACSGATISAGLIGPQKVGDGTVPAQIDQLPNSAPSIITITIGANDAGWTSYLTKCAIGACGDGQDTSTLSEKLSTISVQLGEVLDVLHSKYKSTQLYVTGYYHLYPQTNAQCLRPSVFEDSELIWLNQATDLLNDKIKTTVSTHDYVTYVPLDFSGHSLCEKDPWLNDFGDTAPYHPNEEGQRIIADQVFKSIK